MRHQIKENTMTNTATAIRRILPNGNADCSTLRRVALVCTARGSFCQCLTDG